VCCASIAKVLLEPGLNLYLKRSSRATSVSNCAWFRILK
jgi:hypothetical protein